MEWLAQACLSNKENAVIHFQSQAGKGLNLMDAYRTHGTVTCYNGATWTDGKD